jgi:predicted small secreted protein
MTTMFKTSITRLVFACFAGLLLGLSTGCNTTEGLGKDIEKAGESIQDGAR